MNKTLWIILGLVIVGGGLLWYFVSQNNADLVMQNVLQNSDNNATVETQQNPAQNTNTNNDTKPTLQNSVTLAESDSGNIVIVQQATLTKPGYVVLYKMDSNGTVTEIGHSDLLGVGVHANINIQTDTIVAYKQAVIAVLHADDGDGKYEFPESDFYINGAGKPIVSDVDVVGVEGQENEAVVLQKKVDAALENQTMSTTSVSL